MELGATGGPDASATLNAINRSAHAPPSLLRGGAPALHAGDGGSPLDPRVAAAQQAARFLVSQLDCVIIVRPPHTRAPRNRLSAASLGGRDAAARHRL